MFEQLRIVLIKRFARKRLGKDIAPIKTLETHPGVLVPYSQFNQALNKTNLLDSRTRALSLSIQQQSQ